MRINLLFDVYVSCDEYPFNDDHFTYDYYVDVECQDIVEFLFKERCGKVWNPLSWHLEEGARELVKDIEDSWLRDDIDIYAMLQDLPLRDFLKSKYSDEVERICTKEHREYLKDIYESQVPDDLAFNQDYWNKLYIECEVR